MARVLLVSELQEIETASRKEDVYVVLNDDQSMFVDKMTGWVCRGASGPSLLPRPLTSAIRRALAAGRLVRVPAPVAKDAPVTTQSAAATTPSKGRSLFDQTVEEVAKKMVPRPAPGEDAVGIITEGKAEELGKKAKAKKPVKKAAPKKTTTGKNPAAKK